MIINPASPHFLGVGKVMDDGKGWKTIDLGGPHGLAFEAREVMEYGDAVRWLKALVRAASR